MSKYSDILQQTSDAQLVKILTTFKDQYEDDMIIEATRELETRNIPEEILQEVRNKAVHDRFVYDNNRNAPLGEAEKVLTVIFPFFLTLILSRYFYSKGFIRKGEELAKWTFVGFICYIALGIIIALLAWSMG